MVKTSITITLSKIFAFIIVGVGGVLAIMTEDTNCYLVSLGAATSVWMAKKAKDAVVGYKNKEE